MLKAVVDTSVFIAALLTKKPFNSRSSQTISRWRQGAFTLVMSKQILAELVAKLYEKEIAKDAIIELVETIAKVGLCIPGECEIIGHNLNDPDDNIFLAAAYASHADFLVTLDKKSLLPQKYFRGTIICTPDRFMRAVLGVDEEERKEDERIKELERMKEMMSNIKNPVE